MAGSHVSPGRLPVFKERLGALIGDDTAAAFAEKAGIARQTLVAYKNGDRLPDAEMLRRLCTACGVSADWLLGLAGDPSPVPCAADELGLSPRAVEALKAVGPASAPALDAVLAHPDFARLLMMTSQLALDARRLRGRSRRSGTEEQALRRRMAELSASLALSGEGYALLTPEEDLVRRLDRIAELFRAVTRDAAGLG